MSTIDPYPGPCHARDCAERETCRRWVARFLIPSPPLMRGEQVSLWFPDQANRCLNRMPTEMH